MSRTISLEQLAFAHDLSTAELAQLEEWVRRCPELLEASPGQLYLASAVRLVQMIRSGWLGSVPPSPCRH
jgi:hypothetical protein